ncbi:MAG: ArsR family transcriptional regulator [Candidatus Hydrothermarchaeota archaeon]|nr:ArsR family transcriptional regulator [Candidatus Hydrothermarchaeota archaeon]
MRIEEILDMLGSETRREILQLLSEKPCYITQLSQELNIGQKAIIEHLELMREVGILETKFRKIEKGRPRKYYGISKELILEIKIGHDFFGIETLTPRIDEDILDALPNLKQITKELDKISELDEKEKVEELERIYKELLGEQRKITEARKVVAYLLGQIRNEIKSEEAK